MPLKLDLVGQTRGPVRSSYCWSDVVLYALGVGAKARELDFLYEGLGPKVLPTYAVVPAYAVCSMLMQEVGGDLLGVVHAGQRIRTFRPFAPKGELTTIGHVQGIYDLKRMAEVVFVTETRNEDNDVVCETEWSLLYRFDGGFGGSPRPKSERPERANPPARDADFRFEDVIREEQALLYRLCGDLNPLHADPKIAEQAGFGKPILHGLCTFGYVGRALLQKVCDGNPNRLKSLSGQFRKPVWPGETLVVEGWLENDHVIVRAATTERPTEHVFTQAFAEIDHTR